MGKQPRTFCLFRLGLFLFLLLSTLCLSFVLLIDLSIGLDEGRDNLGFIINDFASRSLAVFTNVAVPSPDIDRIVCQTTWAMT